MVDAENRDKWEDAQQVRVVVVAAGMSPPKGGPSAVTHPRCWSRLAQVSPGSVHLMKVVEDFIHLVGNALKAFQSSLIVTDNLGERRGGLGTPGDTGEREVTPVSPDSDQHPARARQRRVQRHQLPHEGAAGDEGLGPQLRGQTLHPQGGAEPRLGR